MPINIPDGLPTKKIPHNEYFFALEEKVAASQQIRPLHVMLLNLMPTKIEIEMQILRLISKSPLQVSLNFMRVSSHEVTHSRDHLVKFYETFATLKANNYDGLIVTSTPVEQMPFEDMDYWQEFTEIFDWTDTPVPSMMRLCWGAMAKLCYKYGVHESDPPEKLFGVFSQRLCDEYNFLTNGFDELLYMPHSRHAMLDEAELRLHPELQVLSEGITSGPAIIATLDFHEIYLTGHFECGRGTLADEYWRDTNAGKPLKLPVNYFPGDDPTYQPRPTWRAHANLLHRNWLIRVYQMMPYHFKDIPATVKQLHAHATDTVDKFEC